MSQGSCLRVHVKSIPVNSQPASLQACRFYPMFIASCRLEQSLLPSSLFHRFLFFVACTCDRAIFLLSCSFIDENVVSELDYQNGNDDEEKDPHKSISFQNSETCAYKRAEHITESHKDCSFIEYVVCKAEIKYSR
jgi:hypothetical protein